MLCRHPETGSRFLTLKLVISVLDTIGIENRVQVSDTGLLCCADTMRTGSGFVTLNSCADTIENRVQISDTELLHCADTIRGHAHCKIVHKYCSFWVPYAF